MSSRAQGNSGQQLQDFPWLGFAFMTYDHIPSFQTLTFLLNLASSYNCADKRPTSSHKLLCAFLMASRLRPWKQRDWIQGTEI